MLFSPRTALENPASMEFPTSPCMVRSDPHVNGRDVNAYAARLAQMAEA